MKLLMISTDRRMFEPGSAVALRQIEYAKQFDETHIIVFTPKVNAKGEPYTEKVLSDKVWVYPTLSISKWMYPFGAMRLGRFIVEKRGITDVTTEDSSLTAMAGVSLKKQFGINLEINIHADIGSPYFTFSWMNRIRKFLSLQYIPKADKIRVVSNRIKDYLVNSLGLDASKITVRPIPVDVEAIKQTAVDTVKDLRKQNRGFTKNVIMVSRFEPEKNIAGALRAWKEVVAKIPHAGLYVIGEGKEKKCLQALVKSLGIEANVVWLTWADRNSLITYYKTADLYLNTSFFEGYGMTLVEAHAAGTPIVSTDVGVAREMGATITTLDMYDIAQAIIKVLS